MLSAAALALRSRLVPAAATAAAASAAAAAASARCRDLPGLPLLLQRLASVELPAVRRPSPSPPAAAMLSTAEAPPPPRGEPDAGHPHHETIAERAREVDMAAAAVAASAASAVGRRGSAASASEAAAAEGRQPKAAAPGSHHDPASRGFRNPWPSAVTRGFGEFAAMMLSGEWDFRRSAATPDVLAALPLHTPDWPSIHNPDPGRVQVTWIGHASFLVQMEGVNILTDPVFSDRCSPISFMGPKRLVPPPCAVSDLPEIHVVCLSHDHYDHLDSATIRQLGARPHYLLPLGVRPIVQRLGAVSITELDWWQTAAIDIPLASGEGSLSLRATCTPCQHFSGRSLFNRNQTLWASWVLAGRTKRLYFAGDTGIRTVPRSFAGEDQEIETVCPAFEEIGAREGPFDLALVPIGAYSPRWFMSPVHCTPEDAVLLHKHVRSKQSVAMHWGTFVLTDEPILEPPQRLKAELARRQLPPESFIALAHGQTKSF